MLFRNFLVPDSLYAASSSSTIADVQQSSRSLVAGAQKLADAVAAVSPKHSFGTLSQLQAVKIAVDELAVAIRTTTDTLLALSPSPSTHNDGQTVLVILKKIEPIVKDAVANIMERKASFVSLAALPLIGRPTLSLMRANFVSLIASINLLADAFEAASPATLAVDGKLLRAQLDVLFQQVVDLLDDVLNSN